MELTDLTFRLLFLFLPGIIASFLIRSLSDCEEKKHYDAEFAITSFVYGLVSYAILFVIYMVIDWGSKIINHPVNLDLTFFSSLSNKEISFNYLEILLSSIVAMLFSLFVAKIINKGYLYKFAKKHDISYTTGSVDVWNDFMRRPEVCWIVIRDKKNETMYEGYLEGYSTTHESAEVFLTNVRVYNDSTGEFNYETDGIYLSLKRDSIIIEVTKFYKEV